jgi:hypothetical protein
MTRREFRGLARELRTQPREQPRSVLVRLVFFGLRHLPEIVLIWLAIRGWHAATHRFGSMHVELVAGAFAMILVSFRRARRGLLAVGGCIVTRARLRSAFKELRLSRRSGRVPFTLGLRPTSVGERVWLLCPVGVSAEDIADEAERLRAAVFAREVRVTRDRRFSALVLVEVIRCDPLAATEKVPSAFGRIADVWHTRQGR